MMRVLANRAGFLGVAAAVLALAGILAVVTHDGDEDRPAGGPLAAGSQDVGGDPPVTTSSLPPPTSTSLDPSTTTTAPAPATTVQGRATTVTTRGTRAPATAPPRATTSTAAPRPLCAAAQIDLKGDTDAKRFTVGQPVTITSTIRNQSPSPCFYQGYTFAGTFRDPADRTLMGFTTHVEGLEPVPFAPGEILTQSATWNPGVCGQPPCAPLVTGIHSVTATWSFSGGRYEVMTQFDVAAP